MLYWTECDRQVIEAANDSQTDIHSTDASISHNNIQGIK